MSGTRHEPRCEPSGTTEVVDYLITSKHGTDLDTFKRLIRSLDGGKDDL
jgi:hypothetical protein